MVKEGATVIDVGMNRTDDGLFGDVDPGAMERAAYMTPVPGGVGPMTIAMVLQNTVRAAQLRRADGSAGRALSDAAGPRRSARGGVLGRARMTHTGAPCVLASNQASHPAASEDPPGRPAVIVLAYL